MPTGTTIPIGDTTIDTATIELKGKDHATTDFFNAEDSAQYLSPATHVRGVFYCPPPQQSHFRRKAGSPLPCHRLPSFGYECGFSVLLRSGIASLPIFRAMRTSRLVLRRPETFSVLSLGPVMIAPTGLFLRDRAME